MDDYENNGRDYNENIDEGPTDIVTEGFFTRRTNVHDAKAELPEKRCKSCECKDDRKKRKLKKSTRRDVNGGSEKKMELTKKQGGKRGRKKKERQSSTNPFIIFYLEMYHKNPTRCVADVATAAGKAWSKMSAKEKEVYVNKAKSARAKRLQNGTMKKRKGKMSKSSKSSRPRDKNLC